MTFFRSLLMKHLMTGVFLNSVVMIEVGGKSIRTLPKDVAFHPVKDRPLHADFLRVPKDTKVQVGVPVLFVNEELSPGLKRGGVLNVVRHELELVCEADKIPDDITRSEEHTSELQSILRISYAVFCLKKKKKT